MSNDPVQEILGNLDVSRLAQQVGADPGEVQDAAAKVLPALLGGLHANAQDPAGAASLAAALGQHQNDLATGAIDPAQVDPVDGAKVAAHIFGPQQDQVVSQLASTGVSSGLVSKLMPLLAPIVMSYLAKRVTGSTGGAIGGGVLGGVLSQVLSGAAQGAGGSASGANPMGGILGDVLGGLLGHGTKL